MFRVFSILVLAFALTACGTSARDTTLSIPNIVEYDADFRKEFADELDTICGNPEAGVLDQLPRACTFIRDTLELRARLRETQ